MFDGFDGLRHYTVVGGNDENYHVGRFCAASAHHRERFVSRRIEKYDAPLFGFIVWILHENAVCADVLRDSARFAFRDVIRTDRVEQRCFTVVNVSHHGHDRRTRNFDIIGIGSDQFFKFLFDDHFFKRHETNGITVTFT